MIINKSGLTIRMDVADLRVMGRATQGVRLINIKGNDSIAAVTKVMKEEEAPEGEGLEDEATEDADSIVAEETEEPTEE
jgi:DNA gyrase subunit A